MKTNPQRKYTARELAAYAVKLLTIKGFKVWKNTSSGKVAGGRFVTVTKGIPDVTGFRLNDALFIGVEIKTENDRMSEEQKEFAEQIKQAGGIFVEMRSPDDLENALKAA